MIQVRVTQSGQPTAAQLTAFKQYASVPDDAQDAMLEKLLKQAMLKVQEFSDRALLACTLELVISDIAAGERVKLYQGAAAVVSVEDEEGGNVDYILCPDGLYLRRACKAAKIIYTNSVKEPEADRLLPVVWQYATALYDGAEPQDQAAILKTCYGLI
jgi:hypothetical protein